MKESTLGKRVSKLEAAREPKTAGTFVLFGATKDDFKRQQRELIESGKARESDLFVHIRWIYEPRPEGKAA